MRRHLKALLANPIAVLLLIVPALLGGTFALLHLPVGLFPGLDVPVVNVIAHQPGASAEDVELLVTLPIEQRLRALPGIEGVASTSAEGISWLTARFAWGTRLTDARQLVQSAVSEVRAYLPQGVEPRLENIGTTLQQVAGYVVSGEGDTVTLRTAVRNVVETRLAGIAGVSRVDVLGGDRRAFTVTLRPQDLLGFHLTVEDVSRALALHNVAVADDYIVRGSREYAIRGDGRLQTLDDVGRVPVAADAGHILLLSDIAEIREGTVPRHYEVYANGAPAVAFTVSKGAGASAIRVVREVDAELARIQPLLPTGTVIRKYYDQSEIIRQARNDLILDLVVGGLLAVAILFVFLGSARTTLTVALTIPLSVTATLALMYALGLTLNVVTLSGLTLAVGMVVDDAIVVTENIARHLRPGADRTDAVLEGTAEIAAADTSGTLTTVAAFIPLLLLGGLAGLFARPFGLVIGLALLVSLAVSLTVVPVLSRHHRFRDSPPGVGVAFLGMVGRSTQRLLSLAFAHRGGTALVAAGVLLLGLAAFGLGPLSLLPPIDEGALLIEYVMPPGTSLDESNRIGDILDREALALPDVETVYRRTGSPEESYQVEGVNRGELTIKLAPRSIRRHTAVQVLEELRTIFDRIPGVVVLYHQPTQEKMDESLSGLTTRFGVTIYGSDRDTLVVVASRIDSVMEGSPRFAGIVDNSGQRSAQIVVRPDPQRLAARGLVPNDVFQTIRAARFGVPATTIIRQKQQIPVLLMLDAPGPVTPTWLRTLAIPTPAGPPVPLESVAEVSIAHLPAALTRLNGAREVTIVAEVKGGVSAAARQLEGRLASLALPAGYGVSFTGQYRVMQRSIIDFVLAGISALLLVYLIMALQFRSWSQPLAIMVTVPVALVGAIVLLAVGHVGVNISAGMGMLTLGGIAVNNAIVLLDYANKECRKGETMTRALRTAAGTRLRPILITALTTIFALLPVALDPSTGSRIFQAFAVTVIGGLVTSTPATLLLVPVLAERLTPGRWVGFKDAETFDRPSR